MLLIAMMQEIIFDGTRRPSLLRAAFMTSEEIAEATA